MTSTHISSSAKPATCGLLDGDPELGIGAGPAANSVTDAERAMGQELVPDPPRGTELYPEWGQWDGCAVLLSAMGPNTIPPLWARAVPWLCYPLST